MNKKKPWENKIKDISLPFALTLIAGCAENRRLEDKNMDWSLRYRILLLRKKAAGINIPEAILKSQYLFSKANKDVSNKILSHCLKEEVQATDVNASIKIFLYMNDTLLSDYDEDRLSWLFSYIDWLNEVWSICGDRAGFLLYEDTLPLECPFLFEYVKLHPIRFVHERQERKTDERY